MKIHLCTPTKLGLTTQHANSVVKLVTSGLIHDRATRELDLPVGRSRNVLMKTFLKGNCDALLWIDSDIEFEPWQVAAMAEHDLPIVGGLYAVKSRQMHWVMNNFAKGQGEARPHLKEVKFIGTGFLLIKREVFEAVIQKFGPELEYIEDEDGELNHDVFSMGPGFDDDAGRKRWLSEDWWFCKRARECGFQIWADLRVTLKHWGIIDFPINQEFRVNGAEIEFVLPAGSPQHYIDGMAKVTMGEYDIPRMEAHAVQSVLDIGANVGAFAVWARRRFPDARITSVEPHPDNFKLLQRNCGFMRDWHPIQAAAANGGTTRAKLFKGVTNAGTHSLNNVGEQSDEFIEVDVINPASLPSADFVKIDTEGAELEILQHLDLSKTKAIALEYHRDNEVPLIKGLLFHRGFDLVEESAISPNRGVLKFAA